MSHVRRIPRVLSIAGSDSGGGAGIQADLKAFAACGVHGMTAVTAVTAQNTVDVIDVEPVAPATIVAQVHAVVSDIGVDAVKIGMLGSTATIRAVAGALEELPAGTPVVVDPVMVAESGARLLEPCARDALIELVLPLATVVTPNVPEAIQLVSGAPGPKDAEAPFQDPDTGGSLSADLSLHAAASAPGERADDVTEVAALARAVHQLGPSFVVVTGGHRERPVDLFYDGTHLTEIAGEHFASSASHGSGCTHSSVLAARLAWGDEPLAAARRAKELAAQAVRDGLTEIGAGSGPVDVLGIRVAAIPAGSERADALGSRVAEVGSLP